MPDSLCFKEASNSPVSDTLPVSDTVRSEPILFLQEEVERIAEEYGDSEDLRKARSEKYFHVGDEDVRDLKYHFHPIGEEGGEGDQAWRFVIAKPKGEDLELPEHLGDVLKDKEIRIRHPDPEVVEEIDFSNVI